MHNRGRQQVASNQASEEDSYYEVEPSTSGGNPSSSARAPSNFARLCDRVIQDSYTFFD
jgi:hypothetical protein